MTASILMCEDCGPVLRLDHNAFNKCPCCHHKDFIVRSDSVDISVAFDVLAGYILSTAGPEIFSKLIAEIEEITEAK